MPTDTDKPKILIVDDVQDNITLLERILGSEYVIISTTDGRLALSMAAALQPDIILLDIMMPDISGYEVCEKLKTNQHTRHIPVVFISALSEQEDETNGLALGAVDYIHKPIKGAIVRARIKNHLELARARKALEEKNRLLSETIELKDDIDRITRHDLKGPLNAIIGVPSFIKMADNLTDQQYRMLQLIETAGYKMLDMINLSLDLYKMEKGTYELDAKPIAVLDILHNIVNEQTLNDPTLQELIRVTPPADMEQDVSFLLSGDNLLCYSLFANLIKNSIEANPDRQPITISLTRIQGMGAIGIHNYGSVPEEIRSRFFEKDVTAGKKGGTGLGTYSAALIAKTQNGEITLDTSVPGETTVTVLLPLAETTE
ncbi:MAG: hybrid sensor histidine kinase/response regulator, partial [Desulfobulbaceae bacterium]|nr:hybrid sensor histidine kinase/response regulator [Desulfobulbaceae bacterium]